MTGFCLIHGSTQGPSGWRLLTEELERRGHRTICPALPTDQPDAGAGVYAGGVAESLARERDPVVAVAHSASGLFLPMVALVAPVRSVVFLAATIPIPGVSLLDQLRPDPTVQLNPDWIGKHPAQDDAAALEFLFHDCSPEIARWALTTRIAWNMIGLYREPCPMDSWPDVPSLYIVCSEDRTIRPQWSRQAARERLGVEPIELPGGHCPHVSRPRDLAEVLELAAPL